MNHREALNKTLDTFKIPAARLSESSGIDSAKLSKFRNGRQDLMASTLIDLVNALPPDAKAYFYVLIMSDCQGTTAKQV